MKSTRQKLALSIVSIVLLFAGRCCLAADDCKDVLVNKVYDISYASTDNYYNAVVLASLDDKKIVEERSKVGLGVTIEGIPFTLSDDEARGVRSHLSQTYSFEEIRRDRASVLLMSGQAKIIDAWSRCMAEKGGLSLRFEPLDGTAGRNTLLHFDYYAVGGVGKPEYPELELAADVYIDLQAADVKAGQECLAKGKIFRPGDNCIVQLATKSAWSTMAVIALVRTKAPQRSFGYSAYLAPRARMKGVVMPWPAAGGTYSTKKIYTNDRGAEGKKDCQDAPKDHVFLSKSVTVSPIPEGAAVENRSCKYRLEMDPSGKRLCVQPRLENIPAKADYYCTLNVNATAATAVWDPPLKQ